MDLSIYDIIKGPWVTPKAYALNQALKKLVLEVHRSANKPMVAEALKKLFNVETETIRVVLVKGKRRRSGRHMTFSKDRKKAVITLKNGYSADLSGWSSAPAEGARQ